jgi:hypothetical protein
MVYRRVGNRRNRVRLARMFYELPSRDRGEGCHTGQPQGVGSEAYLNSTSQGPTLEDAREDGHIIRARCAPLSPASGFPVSRSQQAIHEISGLKLLIVKQPLLELSEFRLSQDAPVKEAG